MLGQSPLLDEMMEKLQSKINRELKFHQDLMKLRGALDMTLAQVCPSFFPPSRLLLLIPLLLLLLLLSLVIFHRFAELMLETIDRIELITGCVESG